MDVIYLMWDTEVLKWGESDEALPPIGYCQITTPRGGGLFLLVLEGTLI